MLHYVVRSLGWSELAVKMQFKLDGDSISIVGHVDAFEPESATIYELKTSRFVKWQAQKGFIPRESHIEQVQCYATLLGLYGIAVNRLVLIYADDKEIVPKQVAFGNRKQWMIERAAMLHRSLKERVLPKPEIGGSCKYCPFIVNCPRRSEAIALAEAVS